LSKGNSLLLFNHLEGFPSSFIGEEEVLFLIHILEDIKKEEDYFQQRKTHLQDFILFILSQHVEKGDSLELLHLPPPSFFFFFVLKMIIVHLREPLKVENNMKIIHSYLKSFQ